MITNQLFEASEKKLFWLGYKSHNHTCYQVRGQNFNLSARIYKWILERTSDSSQSARPTGQVLKSTGETSIFRMAGSDFIEPNIFSIPKVETKCCDCRQYNLSR